MTIQMLLYEWLETYQKDHIKTRTYSRYKGLMEQHIIPINISILMMQDYVNQQNMQLPKEHMLMYLLEITVRGGCGIQALIKSTLLSYTEMEELLKAVFMLTYLPLLSVPLCGLT